MKKAMTKLTAIFFVLLFAFASVMTVMATADISTETPSVDNSVGHALVLSSESLEVTVGKKIQMTARVSNVETQPTITWTSSDPTIASVDAGGVVKGLAVGRVIIRASATIDGETLNGEFAINVIKGGNFLRDLLLGQQILSYQYSYVDDYYYTNDKEAWQRDFGFGKIYDLAAPYLLLEYDYIRVFFTYADKDWMVQMWKGQYGMVFYGSEIGVYNRDHVDDGMSEWTFFNCPGEEDWLMMEMSLYHEQIDGKWVREFTREYDKYWWCTGFKNGHLRQQEPADELRMEGRITLKDAEMTALLTSGLKECGFGESASKDSIGLDQIYTEGNDIYFRWQNISEAESTMLIKVGAGAWAALTILPLVPLSWPWIAPALGLFAVVLLVVSIVL